MLTIYNRTNGADGVMPTAQSVERSVERMAKREVTRARYAETAARDAASDAEVVWDAQMGKLIVIHEGNQHV
jgi:hypothetical protein